MTKYIIASINGIEKGQEKSGESIKNISIFIDSLKDLSDDEVICIVDTKKNRAAIEKAGY